MQSLARQNTWPNRRAPRQCHRNLRHYGGEITAGNCIRFPKRKNLTTMKTLFRFLSAIVVFAAFASFAADSSWRPANGPLVTRWAKDVKPDKVHPEYPRPQMVRKEWQNL